MTLLSEVMYSLDGEEFGLAELDDILKELEKQDALVLGASYFMAACERVRPGPFDVAADMLELLHTKTYLQAGDAADVDAESVDQEGLDKLNALVNDWASEHLTIAHYWRPSTPIVEVWVTADDMEVHAGVSQLSDLDEDASTAGGFAVASHASLPISHAASIEASSSGQSR